MTVDLPAASFTARRVPKGASDAVRLQCSCECSSAFPVLLFYRYFDAPPALPRAARGSTLEHAQWQRRLCERLQLTGKVRVGDEGINATVVGARADVTAYVAAMRAHWALADLFPQCEDGMAMKQPQREEHLFQPQEADEAAGKPQRENCLFQPQGANEAAVKPQMGKHLPEPQGANTTLEQPFLKPREADSALKHSALQTDSMLERRLFDFNETANSLEQRFFKPSPGCPHVFGGQLSVKAVAEITPMGVAGYTPADFGREGEGDGLTYLEPAEFHFRAEAAANGRRDVLLLDARNGYESQFGHFAGALLPPIRRFSGLPPFLARLWAGLRRDGDEEAPAQVLTYCTGGIRCEKGARVLRDLVMSSSDRRTTAVATLRGGISAYLDWVAVEVAAGRMAAADSLFLGRNYVFDARGSVGLDDCTAEKKQQQHHAARCRRCAARTAGIGKCAGAGCHIILAVCEACMDESVFCCDGCIDISSRITETQRRRGTCTCERDREARERNGHF